MDKLEYEAPRITVVGSVSDVTQGQTDGDVTDQNFPANTPKDQLTFS